jgi:hypothetical protein
MDTKDKNIKTWMELFTWGSRLGQWGEDPKLVLKSAEKEKDTPVATTTPNTVKKAEKTNKDIKRPPIRTYSRLGQWEDPKLLLLLSGEKSAEKEKYTPVATTTIPDDTHLQSLVDALAAPYTPNTLKKAEKTKHKRGKKTNVVHVQSFRRQFF